MSAVIMATVPLFTLILAVLHGQERFTTRGIVGGVLAVAGIGVLSLNSLEADVPLLYVLAAVLGAVAVAESTVFGQGISACAPGDHQRGGDGGRRLAVVDRLGCGGGVLDCA